MPMAQAVRGSDSGRGRVMSDQEIQILAMLGTWSASLGTFAAAGIALWIALRTKKVKLRCTVGLRTIVGGHIYREFLVFNVTNIGDRSVSIENIYWRIGRRKNKRRALQILGSVSTHRFPKKLEHGELASFMVDFLETQNWIQDFRRDFIKSEAINSLRAEIYTSVGHTETVRPEKGFLTALEDAR